MASVTHLCNRQEVTGDVENPHFLLTNRKGDYLALGDTNHSNYDGYFIRSGKSYIKILSGISPLRPTTKLLIDQGCVTRHADDAVQRFTLTEHGMVASCAGRFVLALDCKRLYDESDQGRIYSVTCHPPLRPGGNDRLANVAIIDVRYAKHADDSLSNELYAVHVAIATTMHHELLKTWREAKYAYDDRRGSRSTPWVYDLLSLSGTGKVAIAAAGSESEAHRQALDALIAGPPQHDAPALPVMEQLAWRSLSSLRTQSGIMAGLPWFFHYWSRDELIAAGGLLVSREYDGMIRILEKWHAAVRPDGTLPAIYPDEGLESSDAPGWLGKRTRDLLVALSVEGLLSRIPRETLDRWRESTGSLIDRCEARIDGGLVRSGPNTTWMDTSSNDDGRAGYRIEIQALFLALYDCYAYLCAITMTAVDQRRSRLADMVLSATRTRLVHDGVLLDGLHADGTPDPTVRPNIFIAWCVAPKLFDDAQWARFFDAALPRLWLPWGGLSSIAKDHPNYHASYSGEPVDSYHRGDSWYFVNNIAAMAMHAVDAARFKERIDAIVKASTEDLLWQGYCGHCSELSSAGAQEAAGTHCQAWSASTLLELLHRIE